MLNAPNWKNGKIVVRERKQIINRQTRDTRRRVSYNQRNPKNKTESLFSASEWLCCYLKLRLPTSRSKWIKLYCTVTSETFWTSFTSKTSSAHVVRSLTSWRLIYFIRKRTLTETSASSSFSPPDHVTIKTSEWFIINQIWYQVQRNLSQKLHSSPKNHVLPRNKWTHCFYEDSWIWLVLCYNFV